MGRANQDPMTYLTAADWAVIGGYLLAMIGFGVWLGRGQRNTRDYFLGSRNVPWWGVGMSILATETSALTFIGVPAMAYGDEHLTFIQIVIGYVMARVILAIVLVPHYFKGEIYSPYQLFAQAFGPPARRLAAGFFLIAGTLAAGVRVYVTCIPLELMLGVGILPAIMLFVGLSLIYTYIGGIKAVIWTEAVQFLLFLAGGLYVLLLIPGRLEGGLTEVWTSASAAGKLAWLNTDFSLAKPFNLWMGLFGATFLAMSTHGADQLIVQRVLTCKSVREGRKSLVFSAVIIGPLFLMFLLVGVFLWVYYQHVALAIPLPENPSGLPQQDYIFPIFILTEVPAVFKGFLIVAILAAAMSSVSAAMAALASVSTMDLYRDLARGQRSEAFYLRLSKVSTVFWGLVLALVAYLSREVQSVFNLAFTLVGLTNGAMLGGLALAVFWRRGDALSVGTGMVTSFAVMAFVNAQWKAQLAWPWYTVLGTGITVGVAWGVRAVRK